jgi:hypothetical protein
MCKMLRTKRKAGAGKPRQGRKRLRLPAWVVALSPRATARALFRISKRRKR